jgi:hypothetical protein
MAVFNGMTGQTSRSITGADSPIRKTTCYVGRSASIPMERNPRIIPSYGFAAQDNFPRQFL